MKMCRLTIALLLSACTGACAQGEASSSGAPVSAPSRINTPTPYSAPVAVPSAAGQISVPRLTPPNIDVTPSPAPAFSASCDSGGCWGSDGTRYNTVGGALVRPDGKGCQSVAGVLQCP